jgi:signal transduction histidine kinase
MSVLVATIAAIALAATVTRPIRRLRAAAAVVAGGDLDARAPTNEGPKEVRALAEAFNLMSQRTKGLIDEQRAFAGDASHQLRTPLTALRLRLDQAAEVAETDPASARRRIEAASAEADRLGHLVDGLLALARSEGRNVARAEVDLGTVSRERAESWRALAEEHGVRLVVSGIERASVLAVPGAVEQIVDNYIDNALAATPAGGTIEVSVEHGDGTSPDQRATATALRAGGRYTLHVRDTGVGLPDAALASAFNRFWRSPAAHSPGSGLGLAIVAQLCRASGASASLSNRAGGGIDAAATFDAVPDARRDHARPS